jgi:large subunit ribosomal protein L23
MEGKLMSKKTIKLTTYDVIRKHHLTEKTTMETDKYNQYRFIVHNQATKLDIKRAVDHIYGVNTTSVNVLLRRKKVKTYRGRRSGINKPSCSENIKRSAYKIAIVTLLSGQSIDTRLGV